MYRNLLGRVSFRIAFAFILVIATVLVPSHRSAYASGGEAQLRIATAYCVDFMTVDGDSERGCMPGGHTILRVEGYNQYDSWAVWNAYEHPCVESDGLAAASGWWWQFDKGVSVTLTNGDTHTVTTPQAVNRRWLNVFFIYSTTNYMGITGEYSFESIRTTTSN